jgi:hypothetical protein
LEQLKYIKKLEEECEQLERDNLREMDSKLESKQQEHEKELLELINWKLKSVIKSKLTAE